MASEKLNFSPDRLITGINIIDGMLFFTDGETEPKKININQFKAASHSTGTTVIYGREFLERDITVIKEHPIEAINTNLSDTPDVNVDGEEPIIITEKSEVNNLTAKLFGSGFENGTAFIERGFYYLESNSKPSETTLFSTGIKVDSILNGNQFTGFTETLTADKRYYYAAYGKTAIGNRVEGKILGFYVDATSPSGLTVQTRLANKATNNLLSNITGISDPFFGKEKIILTGKVTNNGNSNIHDVGFAYRVLNENQTANIPTDLLDDSNNLLSISSGNFKKSAWESYDEDTGIFQIAISKKVSSIIYIQAYAINTTEVAEGSIVRFPLLGSIGLNGPDVETNPNSTSERIATDAKLTGSVNEPYGNIEKLGFVFSKSTSNKNQLIQAITSSQTGVFNREVSAPLYNDIFKFKTSEAGLTLTEGETLHFLAYAKNYDGLFGYGNVVSLDFFKKEESKVFVNTIVDPISAFQTSGTSDSITLGLNLVDHAGTIEKLGWFIAKSEIGTNLFPGKSANDPSNKDTLQDLVNSGEAIFFTAQTTDTGEQFKNFTGQSPINIERGHTYYIAATATNNSGITGIGDIIQVNFKTLVKGGGFDFRTNSVTDPGTTQATFNGEIVERLLGGGAIVDAGFVWAQSPTALASLKNTATQHISVSSSTITSINTYLINGTGAGRYFSVLATGLPSNSEIYVQAFIQESNGSAKIYAKQDNVFANEAGEGIVNFRTLPIGPSITKGMLIATHSHETSTGATLTAELTNNGGSGMELVDMSPKFYYMKKATVEANAAATEAARKAYIYANFNSIANADSGEINADITATSHYEINDNRNVVQIMFGRSNHLATPPPKLDSGTQYFYFATANNGVSSNTPNVGTGRFDSQSLRWFQTKPGGARKPFPSDVTVSNVSHSTASFSSSIASDGGDAVFTASGFYYIRSALYTGNTVAGLVASGSKITVNTGPELKKTVYNLDPGTSYKVVAFLQNAQGIGYSKDITTFSTLATPATYSIFINTVYRYTDGEIFKEFNSGGGAFDGDPYVYINISPDDANYTFAISPWDNGDGLLIDVSKVLTNTGHKALKLRCPVNRSTRSRTCRLTVAHSTDRTKTATLRIFQSAGSSHNNYGYYDYGISDPWGNFEF